MKCMQTDGLLLSEVVLISGPIWHLFAMTTVDCSALQ